MGGTRIARPGLRSFLGLLAVAVIVMIAVTGVRAWAVQTFFIPSLSMSPTLEPGDRVLVDKLYSTINRGDIVVFNRAPGDQDLTYSVLVKRVIGLPGETISSKGDTVLIDGKPLAQPWLPPLAGVCSQPALEIPRQHIPSGHYFVMGDCRGDSSDSRAWGTLPSGNIIGKVEVTVWRNNHPWMHWF